MAVLYAILLSLLQLSATGDEDRIVRFVLFVDIHFGHPLQRLFAFDDMSKDGVLSIQVRCFCQGNEEL